MEIEDIIQLLINKTGKTRNDILNLSEIKQLEAGGTISDKAAASLVSKDLGLKLSEITIPQPTKISDLLHMAPGSSNITITGIIKRKYAPNQFSQEDASKVVQNMILIDSSASIRVVMWGSIVTLLKNLKTMKGDQIRIIKGLLKNGRMGEREIHLNDSSSIEKLDGSENDDQIDIWAEVLLPSSITKEHTKEREVDVQGVVINTFIPQENERPALIHIVNPDIPDSFKLKVNFWRERKNEVETLEIGQRILLEGVSIKEGLQNTLEANFNRISNINILEMVSDPKKYEKIAQSFNFQKSASTQIINKDLGSIQLGENFNLTIKIAWIGKIGSFNRKDGSQGHFLRLGIYDETGSNLIVLWDDNAKDAQNFSVHDTIEIHNAYLRENKGNLELSLSRSGSIKKLEQSLLSIPDKIPAIPIQALSKNWKIATLWGGIVAINDIRTFKRNDGSEGSVKSIQILDNTGEIRVIAWNSNIEQLENLQIGTIVQVQDLNIRINNYNDFEAHLTDYSTISIESDPNSYPDWVKNIDFSRRKPVFKQSNKYKRISIDLLTEDYKEEILNETDYGSDYSNIDNYIEFRANIVDIFENPLYYDSCPECSKKVERLSDESGNCPNHNIVIPVPKLLFRVVFDDGLNNIVATLIGASAERLTNYSPEKLKKFLIENENDKRILHNELKNILLGNEYIIKGRLEVRKNFSQENEFNWDLKINYIGEPNPSEELTLLESEA